MEHDRYYRRAREKRANLLIYGFVRVTFQAFFLVYFRFKRIGREHIPKRGPVIIASNHRSFLDPFVIACMARRPMYYVAKKEIFLYNRLLGWVLAPSGPSRSTAAPGDSDFIDTAKAILARGDIVLIFPEGTRTRPGSLGQPRRGVGPPGAGDRRAGRARRRARHRGDPQGLAHPPPQGQDPRRAGAALPAGREPVGRAGRRRHQPHLAMRDAPVGVAGRACRRCGASPSSAPGAGAPRSPSAWPAPDSRWTSAAAPRSRPNGCRRA